MNTSPRAPERAALEQALDALVAQFGAGEFQRCEASGKDLHDAAQRAQCPDVAASAAAHVALALSNVQMGSEVAAWAERALALYVAFGDRGLAAPDTVARLDDSAAIAWVALAAYHAWCGHVADALRAMTGADVSITETASASTRVVVHTGRGITYYRMGLPLQALTALRRALEAADGQLAPMRRLRLQLNVLFASFDAYDLLGGADPDESARLLATMQLLRVEAEALCDELGTPEAWAALAPAAAAASFRVGDLETAARWLDRVMVDGDLHKDHREFEIYTLLAMIAQRRGHGEVARTAVARGRALLEQVDLSRAGPNRLWYAVRLAELAGELPQALALMQRQLGLVVVNHNAALGARLAQLSANLYLHALRQDAGSTAGAADAASGWSSTDAVTGLVNRQALQRRYAQLVAQGQSMMLLLMDVDGFRQINLRHSTAVGDRVLYQVGWLMHAVARGQDELARLGGKTFALLMPDTQAGAAAVLVRRIIHRTAQFQWASLAPDLAPMTYSGGMVEVRPDESFEAALLRADNVVRAAKRAGRARVYLERTGQAGMAEVV